MGGTNDFSCCRQRSTLPELFHKSEVCDLHYTIDTDQYISRFDIAVNQTSFMCLMQALANLDQNSCRFQPRESLLTLQQCLYRLSTHQFHDQIMFAFMLVNVVDRHDIGMNHLGYSWASRTNRWSAFLFSVKERLMHFTATLRFSTRSSAS